MITALALTVILPPAQAGADPAGCRSWQVVCRPKALSLGSATVLSGSADLAVDLTPNPGGVLTHNVTLNLTLTNNGPSTVTAASLSGLFHIDHFMLTVPPGCTDIGLDGLTHVACSLAAYAPNTILLSGSSIVFPIQLTAIGHRSLGSQDFPFVLVQYSPNDPNPADNSDSVTCLDPTQVTRCDPR